MKLKLITLLLLMNLLTANSHLIAQELTPYMSDIISPPDLVPYRQGNLWGYSDISGKIIIEPKFNQANFFCGKLALVTLGGTLNDFYNQDSIKCAIIKRNGEIVAEIGTSSTISLSDTTALINNDHEKFVLDIQGNRYNLDKFDWVVPNGNYLIGETSNHDIIFPKNADARMIDSIVKANKHQFLLNGFGVVIRELNKDSVQNNEYDPTKELGPFRNGLAHMEGASNNYQFMDKKGNVYTCKNPTVDKMADSWHVCPNPFKSGLAILQKNEQTGVIDVAGNIIVPFGKYFSIQEFSDGMALVQLKEESDELIFINSKGAELKSKSNFIFSEPFSGGFARIYYLKGKYNDGFINKAGKTIPIKKQYDAIGGFSDGLCMVKTLDGYYGFLDTTGKEVINPTLQYEEVDVFCEGLCRVRKNNLYGFIDKTGKEIISTEFQEATAFNNGFSSLSFKICDYCRLEIINYTGEKLPYYFHPIDDWEFGYRKVYMNDLIADGEKVGLADSHGKLILEPEFENIEILQNGITVAGKLIISGDSKNYYLSYYNLKSGVKYFKE